jgi:hypothetical protein
MEFERAVESNSKCVEHANVWVTATTRGMVKKANGYTRPPQARQDVLSPRGEAADEKKPEAYQFHPPARSCQDSSFPVGYVEEFFESRTKLTAFFNIPLKENDGDGRQAG